MTAIIIPLEFGRATDVGFYDDGWRPLLPCPLKNVRTDFFICGEGLRVYFDVPRSRRYIDLCIGTEPPEHDQYYGVTANRGDGMWEFTDWENLYFPYEEGEGYGIPMRDSSPWSGTIDSLLFNLFTAREQLYVWIEV